MVEAVVSCRTFCVAYRFSADEPIVRAIPRIAREQLEGALRALQDDEQAIDPRVHEARKHIKRLRALLALVAPGVDGGPLQDFKALLRGTAHTLAGLRGQAALVESFASLHEHYKQELSSAEAERIQAALAGGVEATTAVEETLDAARQTLVNGCSLTSTLRPSKAGWAALKKGFRATYRRARRAHAKARSQPSAECLHAFRTPAKRHFYQLQLFEEVSGEKVGERRKALNELGERLGDHHDLSLLLEELERRRLVSSPSSPVVALARERCAELEAEVLAAGDVLFRKASRQFARRFGAALQLSPDDGGSPEAR